MFRWDGLYKRFFAQFYFIVVRRHGTGGELVHGCGEFLLYYCVCVLGDVSYWVV